MLSHHSSSGCSHHSRATTRCCFAAGAVGPAPVRSRRLCDAAAHRCPATLQQSQDSWYIVSAALEQPPRVLLVDGTNVGALCAASSAKQPLPERFAAWLRFLAAAAAGDSPGTLAAVVVAFDTKGSALTNVRAQQLPGYLSRRSSSSSSSGFAELAGVVEQLHLRGCGGLFLACHAAWGFEADDVLAAAASWCSTSLAPQPDVVIASSDSDMAQLLDGSTYWLQLLQVPSATQPSGLALHSAASWEQQHGLPPGRYPDLLALTRGSKESGGPPPVGLSPKLARTLLQKFGSLEGILASRHALKPFAAAHKLLGDGQPGADARCAAAASSLAVLRTQPQQQLQQLPTAQLQACHAAAGAALGRQQQPQHQEQPLLGGSVSQLHPARQLHMHQCQPYLEVLQQALASLGLREQVTHWTSPSGVWCDLVVRVRGQAGSSPAGPSALDWAAFHVLTPGELSAGAATTRGTADETDSLAEELAARCGCFADGSSALGHATRALLKAVATNGAKRHLSLLKGSREGPPLVVVPFFELEAGPGGGGGVQAYVRAVLAEHTAR